MKDRLRFYREQKKLSRAAFGEKLGLSGDVINNLERGRVEIKPDMIKLICLTYSINEEWFTTGKGDIEASPTNSILEQLKREYNLDEFSFRLVSEYLKLDFQKRDEVREFFYNVLQGGAASSSLDANTPIDIDKEVAEYRRQLELEQEVKEKSGA